MNESAAQVPEDANRRALERIRAFTKDHEIGESSKLARIREVCAEALGPQPEPPGVG